MSCCLCLQPVSADSRKRKNFHGSSCDSVRQTLTRLSHCPLNALVQTSSSNAVICVVCHKKLLSVRACKDKLVALEGDVKNMLSSLTTIRSKRSLLLLPADTELQPPPPKQFRPAMRSLPFSQPPRVTLPTSHSSYQELSGAEHVSVTSTYTHTHKHTHTHTNTHTNTHTHTHTYCTRHTHTHTYMYAGNSDLLSLRTSAVPWHVPWPVQEWLSERRHKREVSERREWSGTSSSSLCLMHLAHSGTHNSVHNTHSPWTYTHLPPTFSLSAHLPTIPLPP